MATPLDEPRRASFARVEFAWDRARASGLLDERGEPRTVRIPPRLLEAAQRRLGLERTTDIVTAALAHIVYEDDFGEHLLSFKGRASAGYGANLEDKAADAEPRA